MSGNQIHSMALSDASNRANLSLARPVDQKFVNGPTPSMPSFTEFMAMTSVDQAAPKTLGPPDRPTAAPRIAVKAREAVTTSATSKKRKAGITLDEEIATYKQNLDHVISPDAFEDDPIPSCNAVRGRINKLLDSGIMKRTEFATAIGVKYVSLTRFLQASGQMGGSGTSTYYNAWAWFRQRQFANLKMPDVKKRQKLEADAAAAVVATAKATEATAKEGPIISSGKTRPVVKTTAPLPDIKDIHLPGEETDDVAVYDSCDEVRRKINAHLKTPGLTQTQFCRDLYAQLNAPKCKGIQSKQLADFRAMKGSRTGARSSVFYTAYVYFEKLRIAQNKPKTAHRLTMEGLWAGSGGFDRELDYRTNFIGIPGTSFYWDQYGMTRVVW
ncbi:hypothetical protein F5X98DRAFT_323352 [Xylaria grammica]|nr:hypothetical protein F5X98DRAFT_323352 [Xylaria grammica]